MADASLIVIAKRECPTCMLVEPLLHELASGAPLTVYVQDDASYGAGVSDVQYDETLEQSYRLSVEIVPTLIRMENGREVDRCYGWHRGDWQRVSGRAHLGEALPEMRPGCGSKTLEPGTAETLAIKFGKVSFASRPIELGASEDDIEACYDRGWSDGLPVVPPTRERVLRMLAGTTRAADEVVGRMPPDLSPCTIEKIAINAVMAGCKPEYMPVLITAIEAVLDEAFAMHGLLCTLHFAGPVVIVNGPAAKAIGMNSGVNALGQGNRANASIGRALQLVVRNVGGGRPGEIDRACLGNPGKYTFCFAEASIEGWDPISVQHGLQPGVSAVTVFAGAGVQGVLDGKSRTPESLARSFAGSMRSVDHIKTTHKGDALLVVGTEHTSVFLQAGWSKARLLQELESLLMLDGDDLVEGAHGIEEGMPASAAGQRVPKFRPGGIHLVHAGGNAGRQTAIIGGWVASGALGTVPVTRAVGT